MEENRKNAYRYLLYWGMLEIRPIAWSPAQWWNLVGSRHARQIAQLSGQIADALHNMAQFAALDFEHFDETRFWDELNDLEKRNPKFQAQRFRRHFERRLDELRHAHSSACDDREQTVPASSDSLVVLLHDEQTRLEFDPVDTAENPPSTAFDIRLRCQLPMESFTIIRRQCWIAHDQLRRFESALMDEDMDNLRLEDMVAAPVLEWVRTTEGFVFRVFAQDSAQMLQAVFGVSKGADAVAQMQANFRAYPKWW